MTNEQEAVSQNCTLWAIKTSAWNATDSISAEDLDVREEDVPDIFRLGRKHLIPDNWRIKLAQPRNKITPFMATVGKRYIVTSVWAVPNKYLEFVNGWFKKIKQEQEDVVDEFLVEYLAIKDEMIAKYPSLANATWPAPDKIKRQFQIQTFVFEIGNAKVNRTDPAELIAIKQKYSQELDQSVKELTDLYVKEAYANIIDNCKDMTERIVSAGKKVTKKTLKKPADLIRQYEDIVCMFDTGDSDEINMEIAKLKKVVSGVTAEEIRAMGPIAEEFAQAVSEIGKNIGDLSGISTDGQMKRTILMEEAA